MKELKEPQMKREVSISGMNKNKTYVSFWATPDAASDIGRFGQLRETGLRDRYGLYIDGRYDVEDVIKYIEEYNNR